MTNFPASHQQTAATIVNYLQQAGFTVQQASAIAGNMFRESNFSTTVVNSIGATGLCQWTSSRRDKLKRKPNWTSLKTQLDFVLEELNTGYTNVRDKIKQASTIDEASNIWGRWYEIFDTSTDWNKPEYTKRREVSKAIYSGVTTGNWQASDIGNYSGDLLGDGTATNIVCTYDVPKIKQEHHELMTLLVETKRQLMYEILDSYGIIGHDKTDKLTFKQVNTNNSTFKTKQYIDLNNLNFIKPIELTEKNNNYVQYYNQQDLEASGLTITETAVWLCNKLGLFGTTGGSAYGEIITFTETVKEGSWDDKAGVCRLLYHAFKATGLEDWQILGCLVNLYGESLFDPEFGAVDKNSNHTGGYSYSGGLCAALCGGSGGGDGAGDDMYEFAFGKEEGRRKIDNVNNELASNGEFKKGIHHLHGPWGKPNNPRYAFRVHPDKQVEYLVNKVKPGGDIGKYLRDSSIAHDCGTAAKAWHLWLNHNKAINYGDGPDPRWDDHKDQILQLLGAKYETQTIGGIGGPIPICPEGAFRPSPGNRNNAAAMWGGRAPKIEDSVTPVSLDPGANGTPPDWVKSQITTVSACGFSVQIHKRLAFDVQNIIKEIVNSGYQLKSIGGFSFRRCKNGKLNQPLSNHGGGGAIDINAGGINPFVHGGRPLASGDDLNPGHIRTVNHPVVKIFKKYGWGWGGTYGDYMHFSINDGH